MATLQCVLFQAARAQEVGKSCEKFPTTNDQSDTRTQLLPLKSVSGWSGSSPTADDQESQSLVLVDCCNDTAVCFQVMTSVVLGCFSVNAVSG